MDNIYFGKAYYSFLHGRLVSKIRSHGIQSEPANWIKNWIGQSLREVVFRLEAVLVPPLFAIYSNMLDDIVVNKYKEQQGTRNKRCWFTKRKCWRNSASQATPLEDIDR